MPPLSTRSKRALSVVSDKPSSAKRNKQATKAPDLYVPSMNCSFPSHSSVSAQIPGGDTVCRVSLWLFDFVGLKPENLRRSNSDTSSNAGDSDHEGQQYTPDATEHGPAQGGRGVTNALSVVKSAINDVE